MSAVDTALRILKWAIHSNPHTSQHHRVPPQGDAHFPEQLAIPSEEVQEALGTLTAITAARLQIHPPQSAGMGTVILAAMIGIRQASELAQLLFRAIPPSPPPPTERLPVFPADWVARHGVVAPALRFLSESIAEDCRLASPLTALLERPASGQDNMVIQIVQHSLCHPNERAVLIAHWSVPTIDRRVRSWRQQVFDRLRLGTLTEQSFVLDVYEAMMIHYRAQALAEIRQARSVLNDPAIAQDESRLQDALAIAQWWSPLWAMERADVNALRKRRYLGYDYREGLALFRLSQKLTGDLL